MEAKISEIVKQVLSEMGKGKSVPVTTFQEKEPVVYTGKEAGKAAVLVNTQDFTIKDFSIPELKKDEVLVKMEGCRVTAADIQEFVREKKVGFSSALGCEGTGVIIKLGSENLIDGTGKVLNCGDTLISVQKPGTYFGNYDRQGEEASSGWYKNYLVLKAGNSVYQTNALDLESRLLIEPAMAVYKAVDRAARVSKQIEKGKRVVVAGCTFTGLLTMAVLRYMGVTDVIALGTGEAELTMAERFGVYDAIDYKDKKGLPGLKALIQKRFGGNLPDAVFYCSDSEMGLGFAKQLVHGSGYLCDMGYVISKNRQKANFEFSMPVSERFHVAADYEKIFDFLARMQEEGIPMYRLITQRYKLEEMNDAFWAALQEEGLSVAVFDR